MFEALDQCVVETGLRVRSVERDLSWGGRGGRWGGVGTWPMRSDMPKRVTIILAVDATLSRSLEAPVVTCVCRSAFSTGFAGV